MRRSRGDAPYRRAAARRRGGDRAGGLPTSREGLGRSGHAFPPAFKRAEEIQGIERFFITGINNPVSGASGQSTLAVMWDTWATAAVNVNREYEFDGATRTNHIPGGSNVRDMDGHVELVRFKSGYPVMPVSG